MTGKSVGGIGVLMGGTSSEKEISLKSGKAVYKALSEAGYDVKTIEINSTDERTIVRQLKQEKIDIVFNVLHGKFGEDGTLQEILERSGFAYTGSGSQASRLAMDKAATQTLLRKNGIRTPDFYILDSGDEINIKSILTKTGGLPVVVKPSGEGSSIGISIVREEKELAPALKGAFKLGPKVVIDRFIEGREITSGILGQEALPLVEIRPKNSFFDFSAKYQKGMSEYIVPAEIPADQAKEIQQISQKVFELIGCRDLGRSDFILDRSGTAFFLEINTIPGFTATSLLPMAAEHQGLDFAALCGKIVSFAARRRKVPQLIK